MDMRTANENKVWTGEGLRRYTLNEVHMQKCLKEAEKRAAGANARNWGERSNILKNHLTGVYGELVGWMAFYCTWASDISGLHKDVDLVVHPGGRKDTSINIDVKCRPWGRVWDFPFAPDLVVSREHVYTKHVEWYVQVVRVGDFDFVVRGRVHREDLFLEKYNRGDEGRWVDCDMVEPIPRDWFK